MFAAFLALCCALIFAATVPMANFTRGKAENMNTAVSLAQKTAEAIRGGGYPNVAADRLLANGLIDNTNLTNISTYSFGNSGETAYPATNVDNNVVSSPANALPSGMQFVKVEQVDTDLRRVTVILAWKEKSVWKSVRIATLVANI